ncbi:MAG: hypothetical protein RL077_2490 [Verrucomicrobiota bacterium]
MNLRKLVVFIASLIIAAAASAQNRTFTNIYAFGDSLSDSGNLYAATSALGSASPGAPYYQGRFSNGPVWVERLGNTLALTVTAAPTVKTSMNFAFGGATAAGTSPLPPSLSVQLGLFRQRAITPGANDLFTVLAGANDLIPVLSAPTSAANPTLLDVAGVATAQVVAINVQALVGLGAKNFVVAGLPNLGATPRALSSGGPGGGGATFGYQASTAFNQELRARLQTITQSASDLNVLYVDTQAIINRVVLDYKALGFANATSAYLAPAAQGGGVGDPNTYVFWDDIHPTARSHALLANIITEQLNPEGPLGFAGTLGNGALVLQHLVTASVDGRTSQILSALRPKDRADVYTRFNYGNGDRAVQGRRPQLDYTAQIVTAGVDHRLGESLFLGGAFNAGRLNAQIASNSGDYTFEDTAGQLYAIWHGGPVALQLDLDYGLLSAKSIHRATAFGGFATTGKTTGNHSGLGFKTSWTLRSGARSFSPWIGVRAQHVDLDGYKEKDVPGLAMNFEDQKAASTTGAIGLDAAFNGKFAEHEMRLDLRGAWRGELRSSTRSVSGRLADNFTRTTTVQLEDGDGSGLELGGALSFAVSKRLTASLAYTAEVRPNDKLANRFTVSLQSGF